MKIFNYYPKNITQESYEAGAKHKGKFTFVFAETHPDESVRETHFNDMTIIVAMDLANKLEKLGFKREKNYEQLIHGYRFG